MKVWTEIAAERLAGNFRALSAILGEGAGEGEAPALLAVVKANAYGHGIDPCAGILAKAGAEWLGVTDAHEGARVRALLAAGMDDFERPTLSNRDAGQTDISHPTYRINRERDGWGTRDSVDGQPKILAMSGTVGLGGEAECVVENGLTAVVWDPSHVERLGDAARRSGREVSLPVHLEIDTGMSRQGAAPGAALDAVLKALGAETNVVLDGVFTHFASTEIAGSEQTAMQQAEFETAIAQIADSGMRPQWVHVGNSSYIDNQTDGRDSMGWLRSAARRLGARAMARSGLALYGHLLPIEGPGKSIAVAKVLPVMTWKTRVIGVRNIPAGALVGYDGAYKAERPMRLALLPLGYADGLRRELSCTNLVTSARPGGWVMIRGEQAAIVGRVSMNLTTVDVSGIAGVVEGDEVVVLGDGVSAEDHARLAGTIAYEILCGVKTAQ